MSRADAPGAGNPQAFNRYAYALNAPTKYTDPSGHDPKDDAGRSMNDNCNYIGICAKTPADVRNSTIVANAGRFNGKAEPLFVPIPGGEDAAAAFDLRVTIAASVFNSESGFLEQPCDQCPFMAVYVSQDVLVAGGDLAAGLIAKVGLTLIGGSVGYAGGKGVDVLTTAVTGAHDFARTFMGLPVYVQVGVSGSGRATVIVYDGYSGP